MATLQGQEIKDTYQALLKTDGNTIISSSLQAITDGQGNTSALALSTTQLYVSGAISNSTSFENPGGYVNEGGTSGSQYFVYNSANRSIYLKAYLGDYEYPITSSLVNKYQAGNPIAFVHTELGLLTGSIESSYFYNGEGSPLTIITLTTDPSNGVNDTFSGNNYPPTVYYNTTIYSVTFGTNNVASYFGHAEGLSTTSIGQYSHTEGQQTITSGSWSHAEGQFTTAIGQSSHTEGDSTTSIGFASHAEGVLTIAIGSRSHAEGYATTSIGFASHAEGRQTTAVGNNSHAEGYQTTSVGQYSHAEGRLSKATGIYSHAEGYWAISSGSYSHAEGQDTIAYGYTSHTEGYRTIAIGTNGHAEGQQTTSIGDNSHAEGYLTTAVGTHSHAEGFGIAVGDWSHAEGAGTAIGNFSHAEGSSTTSIGDHSHAEGQGTIASGSATNANTGIPQHAEGRWNIPDAVSLLIVGNGTADNARKNAFAVTTFGTNNATASAVFPSMVSDLNFANDAAAAAAGVPIGGLYTSGSFVLIRKV